MFGFIMWLCKFLLVVTSMTGGLVLGYVFGEFILKRG